MQLPRGTFQGIRKDIGWADLLGELQGMRFTGSVNFEVDRTVANIVFRKGKMILSEFGSDRGDAALELLIGLTDRKIDASLAEMTDSQLSLALEFNPESRVQNPGRSPITAMKENEIKIQPLQSAEPQEVPHTRTAPETQLPASYDSSTSPSEVLSLVEAMEGGHLRDEPEKPVPPPVPSLPGQKDSRKNNIPDPDENEENESITRDLRALDAMDLDGMSDKIRTNCRLMVEKLNLGHLIESDQ